MNNNRFKILKHCVAVLIVFLIPLITDDTSGACCQYFISSIVVLSYVLLFYLNYFILIDKWLHKKEKRLYFIVVNIGVIILLWLVLEYVRYVHFKWHIISSDYYGQLPPPPDKIVLVLKDGWLALMVIGFSVALKVAENYTTLQEKTNDLLRLKSETELAELKHQLNPHFLFNTLNNIYALIDLSQAKAQNAVVDLSKLLRYALYEGNRDVVLLESDLQFVRNYVELMTLRLNKSVKLTVNIPTDKFNLYIAPMLFITLVENAFKHGISVNKESFIDIDIKSYNGIVDCVVRNSVHVVENSISDRTGIGVKNLSKRLELLYRGRYDYSCTNLDGVYTAKLKIELNNEKTKLCSD